MRDFPPTNSPDPKSGTYIWRGLFAMLLLSTFSCGSHGMTERRINGQVLVSRAIEPRAYALVAYATFLEEQGDGGGALTYLHQALEVDSRSPSIWAKLAHLQCITNQDDSARSFDRAETLDPRYSLTQVLRSQCLERQGQQEAAIERAERATFLAPDSWRATSQWAHLLRLNQREPAAARLELAFKLLYPERASQITKTENFSSPPQSDWMASDTRPSAPTEPSPFPVLEPPLLALFQGRLAQARALIQPLVDSSPADSERLIVGLMIAHRLGDSAWFNQLLRRTQATGTPRSNFGDLQAQILVHWVGSAAAQAWSTRLESENRPAGTMEQQ